MTCKKSFLVRDQIRSKNLDGVAGPFKATDAAASRLSQMLLFVIIFLTGKRYGLACIKAIIMKKEKKKTDESTSRFPTGSLNLEVVTISSSSREVSRGAPDLTSMPGLVN